MLVMGDKSQCIMKESYKGQCEQEESLHQEACVSMFIWVPDCLIGWYFETTIAIALFC